MKLGIDASNLRSGGGVTHLKELLSAANPDDYGFSQIIVWGGDIILSQLEEKPWLRKIHEPLLDHALPMRLYWQLFRLKRLSQREKCDLIFVPGGTVYDRSLPFVTMCQNMLPFEERERRRYGISLMRLKLYLIRLSQKNTFKQAKGIIFLNNYAQQVIGMNLKNLKAKQIIIPHGINPIFLKAPRKAKPLEHYSYKKPFRWIYVSTVDFYKHQWHVVEAVALLRKQGFPVSLDLIGGAYLPAKRKLESVISRVDPKSNFINYHQKVAYELLPQYYYNTDGGIFASSCENMPNILLEMMASGLPIACSKCEPMPKILKEHGEYFNPESLKEISNALKNMMKNHNQRETYAKEAFNLSKQYSWTAAANQTFKFIYSLRKIDS